MRVAERYCKLKRQSDKFSYVSFRFSRLFKRYGEFLVMLLVFPFHQRLVLIGRSSLDVTNLKTDSLNLFEKYTAPRFLVSFLRLCYFDFDLNRRILYFRQTRSNNLNVLRNSLFSEPDIMDLNQLIEDGQEFIFPFSTSFLSSCTDSFACPIRNYFTCHSLDNQHTRMIDRTRMTVLGKYNCQK